MDYGDELFKGTASYYTTYRPTYPSSLIRLLVDWFSLDGTKRILDIGCGPGRLALRLTDWCRDVIGVDPDEEMLAEAKRLQQEMRVTGIEWFQGTFDQFHRDREDMFDLVVFAKSFHWMDRKKTLALMYERIHKGGGIAIIDEHELHKVPEPWQVRFSEVVEKWYGRDRKAGRTTYTHPSESHEEILRQSPLQLETVRLPAENHRWTIDSIIGHHYSTSYGARRFLKGKERGFENEVRKVLTDFNPEGIFHERRNLSVKVGWKI